MASKVRSGQMTVQTSRSLHRSCLMSVALLPLALGGQVLAQQQAVGTLPVVRMLATDPVVHSGTFKVEHPTVENLGFEWEIRGDYNRNARVDIRYRPVGEKRWRPGMPLLRINNEEVISYQFDKSINFVAPNLFAGSILDLRPDTQYMVELTMTDPDGVEGVAQQTALVRTRAEPKPARDGRVFHVYPFDHEGPELKPSFHGLSAAYFNADPGGDWYNTNDPRVQPGDVILVHAGLYKDQRYRYGHELIMKYKECCNTTGSGTYYLTQRGTAERPIVIRAAGDGEVIFDGDGNYNLFNVQAADYTYFEGITFRNTEIAILAGLKRIAGSKGLTVKHSRFENVGLGIHTDHAGSSDFYIADNEFVGRHSPTYMTGWWGTESWMKLPGWRENSDALSQYAVKVYGPGHVVAYNRIRNFHDGIDHATYGNPEPGFDGPSSIDIYNNDISNMHDNCIETDGALYNVRVMRNLCANSAFYALSLQPTLAGPIYFIRNIVYNSPFYGAVKFSQNPAGGVFYNNTFFTSFGTAEGGRSTSNLHVMNNAVLRQKPSVPVYAVSTYTNYSTSDYNGFSGGEFLWASPPPGVRSDTLKPLETKRYENLQAFAAGTARDQHSVTIDLSDFRKVKSIDPALSPNTVHDTRELDARPVPNGRLIDRAAVIPNVTDGYVGKAPDLGAIEAGKPMPQVGPRPWKAEPWPSRQSDSGD